MRRRFAAAALIASDVWSRRVFADRLALDRDLKEARRRALGPFRKAIEEANVQPHLGIDIGRSRSLFTEHMPAVLLQNCMVYVNTLMLQEVLAQPNWQGRLTETDLRALTPLTWEHVNPYGRRREGIHEEFVPEAGTVATQLDEPARGQCYKN